MSRTPAKDQGDLRRRRPSPTRARSLVSVLVPLLAPALALVVVACVRSASGAVEHSPQQPSLAQLAFMSGCWRGSIPNGFIEEYYTTPTSNMIVGVTRYVRGGRTVDFEYSRIEVRDSAVVLIPQPKGGAPTTFRLTVADSAAARWENPLHDFPQVIQYRRQGADSLIAAIEGPGSSGTRRIEWRMGRC